VIRGRSRARWPAAAALATVGSVVLLAGSATAARRAVAPVDSWQVDPAPFRLSFAANGTVVAEADTSGGPGGRLSYRLADGSFHGLGPLEGSRDVPGGTAYTVATDEPGRTAVVTVRRVPTGLSVDFRLEPADGVVATFDAFAAAPDEHFLGGGERPQPLDLNGQALAVKASYACRNTMPAPFFLSSTGYGISLDSGAIAALAFPGAKPGDACPGGAEPRCPLAEGLQVVQLCLKADELSYRVFLGTPVQIVSRYAQRIGRPRMPQPTEFELIKWRDSVSGAAQLTEDADRLHALGIPIGWILLDNPWEQNGCYGTMTFDSRKFPDPAATIESLHARGVKLMLWISPLVRRQWCPPSTAYARTALLGNGNASTIDLTDPAARATFERSLTRLIGLGVDGFKADRGEEIDLEPDVLAAGPGTFVHNLYPLLYAESVAAAVRAAGKPPSFPTMFRAGAPGSSATVAGFWAGDQADTFDGLREAIHDGLSAGVAGYPIWGSDTGGYGDARPALTPEVFVRWAQFSAVSPVFEVGGTPRSATFWRFGPRVVGLFRDAAVLHYELFPYLYGLARAAHATGLPIMRPLALQYPDDPEAWRYDLETLVGPDLLAAPVTVSAPPGGVARPTVYLPPGSWVDLADGSVHQGGTAFERPTPLARLPLYLQSGAAIPFAVRTPLLWPEAWPTNSLGLRGRAGWIYAPGEGRTTSRTPGYGRLTAIRRGTTLDLRLAGAPRQTQVLVAGRTVPREVQIGGDTVARARSLAALRSATDGWLPVRAPFRGIVLKLAPRRGAAHVRLRLP
jgi:alpha-glucosidase (family GH31 glycosyl hydrolase)